MISADFQSEKLVMLLLQVMMTKTDRKAKYYFNCRMKGDTSVRTSVETCDSLASVIFDMRNFKRVNQFVSRDTKMLLDTNINHCYVVLEILLLTCIP